MRKSITLTPGLNDLVSKCASIWHFSESMIINYCISQTLVRYHRNTEFDSMADELDTFYDYYIRSLPRGKKAKEVQNETQKTL